MSFEEDTDRNLLLRGRFTFGLRQAILAAMIGIAIAAFVAVSNLS